MAFVKKSCLIEKTRTKKILPNFQPCSSILLGETAGKNIQILALQMLSEHLGVINKKKNGPLPSPILLVGTACMQCGRGGGPFFWLQGMTA